MCALFIFIGQAFIQLLMLMFLEDTIEYGQWKNGKRSESITLSVQPLINKTVSYTHLEEAGRSLVPTVQ